MSSSTTPTASNGQGGHRLPQAVDNKKLGLARRSTPDSEALLSSDDDHDTNPAMSVSMHSVKSVPSQRPIRRGSWLSEVRTAQRKYSLGGLSLASTGGNSQPPTPSAENGHPLEKASSQGQLVSSLSLWDSTPARPTPVTNTPWGPAATSAAQPSSFWGPKEAPRWSEFQSSPAFSSSAIDDLRSPTNTTGADNAHSSATAGIPFDIPLEPNRKTVRSQSYSAGQLDLSSNPESSLFNRFKPKRNLPPSLARRKSKHIMDSGSEFDLASVQEDLEMQTPFNGGVPLVTSPHSERARMAARQSSTLSLDKAEMAANSSDSSSDHAAAERRPATSSYLPHGAMEPAYSNAFQNYPPAMNHQEFLAQRSSQAPIYQMPDAYHPAPLNPIWARELAERRAQAGQMSPQSYGQASPSYSQAPQQYNQNQQSYGQGFQPNMQTRSPRTYQQLGHQNMSPNMDTNQRFGSQASPSGQPFGNNQRSMAPAFIPVPENVPENVVTQAIQNAAIEAQAVLAEGEHAASTQPNYNQSSVAGVGPELSREDMMYNLYSRINMPAGAVRSPLDLPGLREPENWNRNAGFAQLSPTHEVMPQARNNGQQQPLAPELDGRYQVFVSISLKNGSRIASKHVTLSDRVLPFPTISQTVFAKLRGEAFYTHYIFAVIYHGGIPTPDDMVDIYNAGGSFMVNEVETRNLYLVTFKASRAEVFRRPLGFTGDLSEGQMVIVEGDRGLDMGMIAHVELNHEQAKALKAEYNRKHYHTLVRFSRNYPHLAESLSEDPDYEERASQNLADQALGPLGTPGARNAPLTPKNIRRVATEREIMLLREKEGNEARAKRICQGKVNQQHLSMEILDAEFQL
jgi:hypothetical protein